MSVHVLTWVFHSSVVAGGPRLVLLALADEADDDGYCWPGMKRVAAKARVSLRSAVRHVQTLEEAGELVVHRRIKERRSSEYVVVMGRDPAVIEADRGWGKPSGTSCQSDMTPSEGRAKTAGGRANGGMNVVPTVARDPLFTREKTRGESPPPSEGDRIDTMLPREQVELNLANLRAIKEKRKAS